MKNFPSKSQIATIVAALIPLGVQLFFSLVDKNENLNWGRLFILTLVSAAIGFCVRKIIEIDQKINEFNESLDKYGTFHNSSIAYLSALVNFHRLEKDSPLRFILHEELEAITSKLKQIELYELKLRPDEVIPIWGNLIQNSNKEILAINTVALSEWNKFTTDDIREKHKIPLNKGANIKRVFVYNRNNQQNYENLIELAKTQKSWGVEVRLLSGDLIHSPFLNKLIDDDGTKDVAIFDELSVLLTNAPDGNIISATLTNNSEKLKKAKSYFQELWRKSEQIKE
jgi:hypothetical protein